MDTDCRNTLSGERSQTLRADSGWRTGPGATVRTQVIEVTSMERAVEIRIAERDTDAE